MMPRVAKRVAMTQNGATRRPMGRKWFALSELAKCGARLHAGWPSAGLDSNKSDGRRPSSAELVSEDVGGVRPGDREVDCSCADDDPTTLSGRRGPGREAVCRRGQRRVGCAPNQKVNQIVCSFLTFLCSLLEPF